MKLRVAAPAEELASLLCIAAEAREMSPRERREWAVDVAAAVAAVNGAVAAVCPDDEEDGSW